MSRFPAVDPRQAATENRYGIMKFANSSEAVDTNNDSVAISPKQLNAGIDTFVPDATASVEGKVELATDTEAQAKSVSTNKALVPANLAASGFLQWADVTITATEIKALATTAKELVAAPAAGSAHLFLGAVFKLNYGSEVFTEAGDNLGIKYTNASGVQVSDTIECTGFIDQSADTQTNAVPVKDAIVASASAEAQALVLDNLGNNFGGNASDDSTITCRVYYVTQAL